jgi:hypothetical protein
MFNFSDFFVGCDVPKMKNVVFNNGVLLFRKSLQCKPGYKNLIEYTCVEKALGRDPTDFKCCELCLAFMHCKYMLYKQYAQESFSQNYAVKCLCSIQYIDKIKRSNL